MTVPARLYAFVSSHWRYAAWSVVAFILTVPAVAMQFTDEVNWNGSDFAFAAVFLVGAVLTFEVAVRMLSGTVARVLAGGIVVCAVLLLWAEAAVGIF